MTKDLELTIERLAIQQNLPILLIAGIVMAESSGRWGLTRHEPNYRWVVDANTGEPFRKLKPTEVTEKAPGDFKGVDNVTTADEEWEGQRTSFGPMQIMGAVAREMGFKGPFEELKHIQGMVYGAQHLRNLHNRFFAEHGLEGVIAAYNCGQPKPEQVPEYISKVTAFMDTVRPLFGG